MVLKKGKGIVRVGFLMSPQPLANFEMQSYYQNEDCDGVFKI